jgi:hypothetical protein
VNAAKHPKKHLPEQLRINSICEITIIIASFKMKYGKKP